MANAVAAVAASRTGGPACPTLELETLPAGHADYPGDQEVGARSAEATRAHIARCLAG